MRPAVFVVAGLAFAGCGALTAPYRQRDPLPLQLAYEAQVSARLERDGFPADGEVLDRAHRNELLNQMIFLADRDYAEYETSLYVSSATLNTATDLAVLGATGAATALSSGGSLVATGVLTGLASALTGGRLAVQDNFFQQHGRIAVIATMRALRARAAVALTRGMRKSVPAYPLSRGILDVQAYIHSGSTVAALQSIAGHAISGMGESESALVAESEKREDGP